MEEIEVIDPTALEGIRRMLLDYEIVDGPPQLYLIVQALRPELIHKVKPPLELMH